MQRMRKRNGEKATWRVLGGEAALREKNKIADEGGGYGRMMEMGRKICLWQEKETKPAHY